MSTTPTFVGTQDRGLAQITHATGTTAQTLYTPPSTGSKIVALIATSTDSVAQNVQIGFVFGGTTYILGTTPVPANAGNNGLVNSVNLLSTIPGLPVDNDGQTYFFMKNASDSLTVVPLAVISVAALISVMAVVGDF
jgi:hypothetical protein